MRVLRDLVFRNRIVRRICANGFPVFAALIFGIPLWADSFSFSLVPADGNVTAAAGLTAGWGYSITERQFVRLAGNHELNCGTVF